jgi:hypothetical protein
MVFWSFAAIGEHHGDLWAETNMSRVLSDWLIQPSCAVSFSHKERLYSVCFCAGFHQLGLVGRVDSIAVITVTGTDRFREVHGEDRANSTNSMVRIADAWPLSY